MTRKVLVTGGAGFIGSHLVKRLVSGGADVTVLVRYNSVIDNVRLAGHWDEITRITADIRDSDALRQLRDKSYDAIFHLAAFNHVGDSFFLVNESLMTNGVGTANLLECGVAYGRFVYVSSSEVYGVQDAVPFQERMAPNPVSPYSIGKYGGELYALYKRHQGDLPIVCVRPFNTFGPYQSERAVIPELAIKCLRGIPVETTEGSQTREFNYVNNQIDGIMLAAEREPPFAQVINIGSRHEIAIRDLAKLVHERTASRSELRLGALEERPTEIPRMSADYGLAAKILGWTPKIGFEEGLDRTLLWYREYVETWHRPDSALRRLS